MSLEITKSKSNLMRIFVLFTTSSNSTITAQTTVKILPYLTFIVAVTSDFRSYGSNEYCSSLRDT